MAEWSQKHTPDVRGLNQPLLALKMGETKRLATKEYGRLL